MTLEEIKLRRFAGQHLLTPANTQTVVKDLCGVQAQFLSCALHGLFLRCNSTNADSLIKSWTNRGTMHLFSADDLPLFLHEGRTHFLRPVDTMESDAYINAHRKAYFADLIIQAIVQGIDEREALKEVCKKAGMTESESQSLFDPWGGIIRALCEAGCICHKVQEKKAYQLCPTFVPMQAEAARLELVRRYFTHFGPATIKDAAYFFGTTQAKIKTLLTSLPITSFEQNGKTFYYIDNGVPLMQAMPRCLFLAGFDQLMLGYEKTGSLFLPKEHLRDIFSRAGIVRPAILVNGTVAGWWNLKNQNLKITLLSPVDKSIISDAANHLWHSLKQIKYL